MKKKTLALVLCIAMVLSMFPVANAAVNPDYKMALVGTVGNLYDSVNGVTFDMQIQGPAVGSTASIIVKIDATKLEFVTPASNTPNTVPITNTTGLTTLTHPAGWGDLFASKAGWVNSVAFLGGVSTDGKTTYLAIQPEFSTTGLNTHKDALTSAATFCLAFKDGVTADDLDASTVQMCTIAEIDAIHQSEAATVTDGSAVECNYNPSTASGKDQTLAKPEITYPGSDVMNLKGVKVDAANRYVNVPVSLPNAGTDVTVQASAKGYYDASCTEETKIPDGVNFTYSAKLDDGSALPKTVAIDANTGVLTVKAGAPADVVVITADGTYTNTKGQVSTKSGTFNVELCHGDAGKKEEDDKTEPEKQPGGEPDPTKTISGVAIYEEGAQVITSAATGNYEKAVAIPTDAAKTVTFEGKVVDQFGDPMTGENGAWAVTKDSAAYTGTNPGFSDSGVVTVSPNVAAENKGTYVYTYSKDTYKAAVEIAVNDNAITWPTLTKDTIVYGQTTADLTYDTTNAKVEVSSGTVSDVVFAWKESQDLTVASNKAIMVCNYKLDTVAQTPVEHEYPITVNKANQVIETAVDADITSENVLEVSVGETVDLQTVVKNADVDGVTRNGAATYSLTDTNGLVSMTDGKITGVKQSANDADVATLTIDATDDANYNDATPRTIKIHVARPLLAAIITFDKTAPVFGETITATITEADGQAGSLTADVTYQWGHMVPDGDKEKFEAITGGTGVGGNLTAAVGGKTTLTYTPVEADVNQTLALQVNAPKDDIAGYVWVHGVQEKMAAAVDKATPADPTITVSEVKYNKITVDPIEGAQYAIQKKSETGDPTWSTVGAANANVFTGLDANTEYTISVKLGETNTHKESGVVTKDQKTAQKTVTPTPNPGGDPDPIPADITGVTVTAAITEPANGLKFNETLTASVTVDTTNASEPVTINDSDWDYQWIRVTPGENGAAATEEVISGAAGTTYTLAEGDIGKIIKVKATTKDTCEYAATAEDTTSGAIAKADGPTLAADGIAATETSAADATDGAITIAAPADLTKDYEYRLKAAEGATENAWTGATISDGKLADNLGIGTYEIRIKGTTTVEPSNTIEVEVKSAGHNITGVVVSYNAKNPVTYELYKMGENGQYETSVAYQGTAVNAADTTTAVKQTQNLLIEGVADGTYKLVIKKTAHVTYTIKNVKVNGQDVDLTKDAREAVHSLEMAPGELTGDGTITVADKNLVTNTANYGKTYEVAQNNITDINGDGTVTVADKNLVTNATTYGKATANYTIE